MSIVLEITKTCSTCQKTLPGAEFAKKRNGLASKCKPCQRTYNNEHYRKNTQAYKEKAKRNRPKCEKEGCKKRPYSEVKGSKPRFCFIHKEGKNVLVHAQRINSAKKAALRKKLYNAQNWQKKKEWFNDYRSKQQCLHCGEKDVEVFEFHHINPSTKLHNIAEMLACSQKRLEEEIAKCVVLCRNCHTKVTQDERNSFRSKFIKDQNIDNISKFNRRLIIDYLLKNPCVRCGYKDIRCLEFDHIDPTSKCETIAYLVHGKTETLIEELKKCQVLCGNCHRRKSNAEISVKRKLFLEKRNIDNGDNGNNRENGNGNNLFYEEHTEEITMPLKRRKINLIAANS